MKLGPETTRISQMSEEDLEYLRMRIRIVVVGYKLMECLLVVGKGTKRNRTFCRGKVLRAIFGEQNKEK